MSISLQKIAVADLPLSREFPTRFGGDARNLQTSIQNHGQLNPIHLWKTATHNILLDGQLRLETLCQLGAPDVLCVVHSDDVPDLGAAFLLSLELNRFSRTFNIIEKAQLLDFACVHFGGQKLPSKLFALCDIPNNIKSIQNHRRLLKLPQQILNYAANNALSLPATLGFMHFPSEDLEKIASRLFVFPLNQNKLSEILTLLFDLSRRENKSGLVILDEIFADLGKNLSGAQREQSLRLALKKRRNPHYEKRLEHFEKKVREISVSDTVDIQPTPFFEDDAITIHSTLKTTDDLIKLREALHDERLLELLKQ